MVLEKNIKSKMDRENNEWWSFQRAKEERLLLNILKNRRHNRAYN